MYRPLVPCPSCARHVRTTERACLFCDALLAPDALEAAIVPGSNLRTTRAATFVLGATLALAGCASTPGSEDGAVDGDAAVSADAPSDNGTSAALYGDPGPAPDGG